VKTEYYYYPLAISMEFQMALVTWYKKYSVNNAELDNHHKKLFDIINNMYDTCLKAENVNCAEHIIEELIEYTNYHFSAEENYMVEKGYNDIDEHKKLHKYILDKLNEMQQVENKNDYDYKKELLVILGNWILQHVTVEDKKYSV
jgi:hemerythrin